MTKVSVPRPPFSGTQATVVLFARNSLVDTDRGCFRLLNISIAEGFDKISRNIEVVQWGVVQILHFKLLGLHISVVTQAGCRTRSFSWTFYIKRASDLAW